MDRRCADCRELISAYIDGELNVDERAWLRNHLAGCAECRAVLEGYKRDRRDASGRCPASSRPSHLTSAIYARTIDASNRVA